MLCCILLKVLQSYQDALIIQLRELKGRIDEETLSYNSGLKRDLDERGLSYTNTRKDLTELIEGIRRDMGVGMPVSDEVQTLMQQYIQKIELGESGYHDIKEEAGTLEMHVKRNSEAVETQPSYSAQVETLGEGTKPESLQKDAYQGNAYDYIETRVLSANTFSTNERFDFNGLLNEIKGDIVKGYNLSEEQIEREVRGILKKHGFSLETRMFENGRIIDGTLCTPPKYGWRRIFDIVNIFK